MRQMSKRQDGVFKTKVVAHGRSSLGLTIPKEICREVNLKKGQRIYVIPKENGVFEVHLQMIFDEVMKREIKSDEIIVDPSTINESDKIIVTDINVESKEITDPKSFEI